MREEEIRDILISDITKDAIEEIKIAYNLTDSQIEKYIEKAVIFFSKIDNIQLRNIDIANIFEMAVLSHQSINFDYIGEKIVEKRRTSFYKHLKTAYVKLVESYLNTIDYIEDVDDIRGRN